MKKKLLTIMILGCMAVSLVACGGNKNADTNNSNQAIRYAYYPKRKQKQYIVTQLFLLTFHNPIIGR